MNTRNITLREGSPLHLGAVPDNRGTNFAVFSSSATKVEVCLFDRRGETEIEVGPDQKIDALRTFGMAALDQDVLRAGVEQLFRLRRHVGFGFRHWRAGQRGRFGQIGRDQKRP